MLATADHTTRYSDSTVYQTEWTESLPVSSLSWLNILTAQPIPEETDGNDNDTSLSSVRHHSGSHCSSSSIESCYVVLEIQRPRTADETSNKIEESVDEEEEIHEEIEEFHFAQTKIDNHRVEYHQMTETLPAETLIKENAVENQEEQCFRIEEYAKVIETKFEQMPTMFVSHSNKISSRFSKRTRPNLLKSMANRDSSTSSDDEPRTVVTKLKTIRKMNEYHSTAISTVAAEQKIINYDQSNRSQSKSISSSTTSLDSIETKSTNPMTTTFSDLSTQRQAKSIQNERREQFKDEPQLIRTFAFDRACMEKYCSKPEIKQEVTTIPVQTNGHEYFQSFPSTTETNKQLDHHSDAVSTPFYLANDTYSVDESENDRFSSISGVKQFPQSSSKGSSFLHLMKKCARTVSSEYHLTQNNKDSINEPTLLEVKYLDGRISLKDENARDSLRKIQTLSDSIASRLNRLGLTKISSTQDLSTTSKSLNGSCRKRILTRVRNILDENTTDLYPTSQSKPWQHKTLAELFHERKYKVNRQ